VLRDSLIPPDRVRRYCRTYGISASRRLSDCLSSQCGAAGVMATHRQEGRRIRAIAGPVTVMSPVWASRAPAIMTATCGALEATWRLVGVGGQHESDSGRRMPVSVRFQVTGITVGRQQ
jgi:hypothetical protein